LRVASDWFNTAQIRKKKIISIFSITSHTERPAHQVRLILNKSHHNNIICIQNSIV
jgi:predicted CoA-binding protein